MTNTAANISDQAAIDFLWLELTNRCNLKCTHCYAESGPMAETGTITSSQYRQLLEDAFALGCRRVQFIGGEPTLYPQLLELIATASHTGYEFIELFTNLTRLTDDLLECLIRYSVNVATSVYGGAAMYHDPITQVDGSFERTIKNLRRLVDAGVPTRTSTIEMDANKDQTKVTLDYLHTIGVQDSGVDRLRMFGRGVQDQLAGMSELCGKCASGTLCISPSGEVYPCIMSKSWPVGSLKEASLAEIVHGSKLSVTRRQIHESWVQTTIQADCLPSPACGPACAPYCGPGCNPHCGPTCNPACGPQCRPYEPWR